ncbi:hypothetical protein BDZ97DRAFT_1905485 [Flammula alnicola]|nr:hypothetical protein BDZ97DRAFT_1905485 [Flammula alnicola]
MPLVHIELCDFKSYRTIVSFHEFYVGCRSNGAGKPNLMDAISSQLKDLVYRGRRLAAEDGSAPPEAAEDDEVEGEGTAKKAWVTAVISTTGASEYKLNNKVITYSAYNAALISNNILVKPKNFLVFQGDVEAVASQSPRGLSRLIEQISGSLELASEYEKAKEAQERATENATFNFTKRRGIAGEIKQYKEQKSEADRFDALCQERNQLILKQVSIKLYHIDLGIEGNTRTMVTKNKELAGFRQEQKAHDQERPELVATEAQITHASRKLNNALKSKEDSAKNEAQLKAKVAALQQELTALGKAAQRAQGEESSDQIAHERQSLETLAREENCGPSIQGFEEKKITDDRDSLQAGAEKHESEKEAKLKETPTNLQRVRGRIVDLCKPIQRKYETAVSVVLGRNIDAIIVDEENTAIDCMSTPKPTDCPGHLHPSRHYPGQTVNDKFRSFAKGACLAVDRAIQHACGNALVCDTVEVARYVCYERKKSKRNTGGSIIHKSGLITKWVEKDIQGLIRARDNLLAEQRELSKQKPRGKTDEAWKLRLAGIKDVLKHIDRELKAVSPELKKAHTAHKTLQERIAKLSATVNAAEDSIFCSERQLKVKKRVRHALASVDKSSRVTFVNEGITTARERLARLDTLIDADRVNLTKLEEQTLLPASVEKLKEELGALQETLEEKTRAVEQNDEIEKLALERSALYRKCRLEEIQPPLLEGDLKHVPMKENLREAMAMDVDEDENGTQWPKVVADYGIQVDFDLDAVEMKLADTEKEAEKARKYFKNARESFNDVKKRRKVLTKGKASPMGGVASQPRVRQRRSSV